MVLAEQQRERLHTQGLTAYSPHGLGEQGKADVELAGKHAGGNLGAEELGRDDRDVRAVALDGGQDRAKGLVTSHRGIAETLFLALCVESLLGACASVGTRVAVASVGVSTIDMSKAPAVLARQRTWNSTRSASVSEWIASNISLLADQHQRAALAGPDP